MIIKGKNKDKDKEESDSVLADSVNGDEAIMRGAQICLLFYVCIFYKHTYVTPSGTM